MNTEWLCDINPCPCQGQASGERTSTIRVLQWQESPSLLSLPVNLSVLLCCFLFPNPLTMSPKVVRRSTPCPNPLSPCPAYLRINRPRYAYARSRLDIKSTNICTVPHSESSSCAIGCRVHKLRKPTTYIMTDGDIKDLLVFFIWNCKR